MIEKNKEEILINNNFINLKDNKTLVKIKEIISNYNNIDSNEFNELLLFTFENQRQAHFISILNKCNNEYTEKTCEEILSKISIGYLKMKEKIIMKIIYENYMLLLIKFLHLFLFCNFKQNKKF